MSTRLYYQNNSLYTEDGKKYKGKDEFAVKTLSALNKIALGDFGSSWMSEMVGMKDNFNIKLGAKNEQTGNNAYVNYEENEDSNLPTTDGSQRALNYVRVGHEFAHDYSRVKRFNNSELWFSGRATFTKDEWYASLMENFLRQDHSDPLRSHYSPGLQMKHQIL